MAVRIGGQAVIEGVMMKNMDRYAVSVRKPNWQDRDESRRMRKLRRETSIIFNYQFFEEWQISWNLW